MNLHSKIVILILFYIVRKLFSQKDLHSKIVILIQKIQIIQNLL